MAPFPYLPSEPTFQNDKVSLCTSEQTPTLRAMKETPQNTQFIHLIGLSSECPYRQHLNYSQGCEAKLFYLNPDSREKSISCFL